MPLSDARRKDIVEYRLEKSRTTLEEVKEVAKLGYWSLAANRLYYATYYACVSLLISKGIEATTHKGTMKMINYLLVKEGLLQIEDAKLISRLFLMRQSGDYEDLFDWSEKDILPLIPEVTSLIDRITSLINTI